MKQQIPNILTYARLVLCLVMFGALALIMPIVHGQETMFPAKTLAWTILITFAVGAITDFFDGYLARKWNVVSMTGAILDPIADKVLVCGAILGLVAIASTPEILIPSGVILFREFAISALREVLAPKGIKLPVTFLAKTKTTLQLVAIAFLMAVLLWGVLEGEVARQFYVDAAYWLYYIAAGVTVWTGVEYGKAARKALRG